MTSATGSRVLRLGARTSPLARAQVELVAGLLAARGVPSSFVGVTTRGDVDQRALTEIGGTGVFAGAVRDALRHGEIDVAVHSLKDLPTAPDPDLEVVAVPEREDTRDVLVGRRLADLDDGARVGTGAPRRAIQLQDWAEKEGRRVVVVPVRGNVDTRLGLVRSGQVDAVLLAAAGLRRLGYLQPGTTDGAEQPPGPGASAAVVKDLPAEVLPLALMLPAPGQGALALEVAHTLDEELKEHVRALDHAVSHAEALTERAFLGRLEAGCTAPVGARAVVKSVRGTSHDLTLSAVIGRTLLSSVETPAGSGPPLRLEVEGFAEDPADFGTKHASGVLATLQFP
ncbi:hydroxymethylbilane synthase [Friedmanniella luteola]|uniref:Hydroxymethylbilane synthase n=1 Tax=Friedmanniella luteola TaxID=546871 RepID=A0A1H1LTE4_9ACTN|nr:hydroxymethylbilane synthase [Friedmanniella luteola]SDR77612.1 hydroxymethylbilane synthase [Friedmanniella luteola]